MSRYYIGFTTQGPTVFRNVRKDETGEPLILVDEDETKTVVLDLTAYLEGTETVSSVATEKTSNVTATPTLTSPTISVALSNVTSPNDGYVVLLITLSSGEIIRQTLRVRRPVRFGTEVFIRDFA